MSKLFHVFKDPKGYYLYDLTVNGIKKINEDTFNELMKVENEEVDFDYTSNTIKKLQNEGFLLNIKINKLEHYAYEYIDEVLQRKLSTLVLQITQDCNLKCSYCSFTENDGSHRLRSNKRMNVLNAKKAIDFLKKNSIDSNNITISFYGGEPFLEFKLIQEVVEYSNNIFEGKEIVFSVTTNATCLTDEILKFIESHNFILTISIDGNKYVNDKKRKFRTNNNSVFDRVKVVIEKIATLYPSTFSKLGINMVLDPKEDFKDYYNILKEIPILSKIRIATNICGDDHSEIKNVFSPKFTSDYQYYDFFSYLKYINRYYTNTKENIFDDGKSIEMYSITNNMIKRNISSTAYPNGPCIPGYRKLFVSVDGTFMPCEKINENSDIYKIGSIDNGFDFNAIRKLLHIATITEDNCKTCWAFNLCTSCLLYCDGKSDLSTDKRLSQCKESRNSAEYMLRKYVMHNNVIEDTSGLALLEE